MGLVARAVEAAGTPTIALSIAREITEKTPPPRALFLRYPFGHALGEPGNRAQQLAVLLRAFEVLFDAGTPGTIVDAGYRWHRDRFEEPDWARYQSLGPRGPFR